MIRLRLLAATPSTGLSHSASNGPVGSNPLGRRFLHGATSRILLSWAILFDAATLLSVFEPGEKNDDDIE
jgi:hypothetical protein